MDCFLSLQEESEKEILQILSHNKGIIRYCLHYLADLVTLNTKIAVNVISRCNSSSVGGNVRQSL